MATSTVQPTLWERTKNVSTAAYTKAKPGFDKVYNVVDKLGKPVNRLSNKVGAEAFWPTTMDKESEKAARILRGFVKDGFYDQVDANEAKKVETNETQQGVSQEGVPQGKQRVMVKIPTKVIKEAKGLAIFTTMRTGWVFGGSGGAGVLVARHPETGEWSPPSGIQTQNMSVGFLIGVDIYDTVLVINTYKALEAFTKIRMTLGTEVGVAAGPVGLGGALDSELMKRHAPIWSYVKSRGFYAGVAVEGNLVIERTDENAKFYGYELSAQEILAGKVRHPPVDQYRVLVDTLKAAQGDAIDESLLPEAGVAPSDMELDEGKSFGVPDPEDADPFGVKALEAEGMVIREAGTHQRPSADAFEFKPAPSSPIYGHFSRKSVDGSVRGKTWRSSTHSLSAMSERGTQTDEDEIQSPRRQSLRRSSLPRKESQDVNENSDVHESPERRESFSDIDSDAEIHTATPVVSKARVVSVPKRVPPALPPRNPGRVSSPLHEQQMPSDGFDQISLNGTGEEKENTAPAASDVRAEGLSRATSVGGDDQFESMPNSPTEEKAEDKAKEGFTTTGQS